MTEPPGGRLSLPGVGGASHDPARTKTHLERARGKEGPAGHTSARERSRDGSGEARSCSPQRDVVPVPAGGMGLERLCHLSKAFLTFLARFIQRIESQGPVNPSERLGCLQGGVWRAREPGFPRLNSRGAQEGGRSPGHAPHVAGRAARPGAAGQEEGCAQPAGKTGFWIFRNSLLRSKGKGSNNSTKKSPSGLAKGAGSGRGRGRIAPR